MTSSTGRNEVVMQLYRELREDVAFWGSSRQRLLALWRRIAGWQKTFSFVSGLGALTLVATFAAALLNAENEISRGWALFWTLSFMFLAVTPLALGRLLPRWAGLIGVGYYAFWSAMFMSATEFGRTEVMPVLQVPVIALYLGWFYRPWTARASMTAYLLIMLAAAIDRTQGFNIEATTAIPVLYSFLIAGFCLEAGSNRRRQAELRALRDPLTSVYNRRGLVEIGKRVLHRALSANEPLTVAVADFDDFKAVNDAGGHAAGDEALCATSQGWVQGLGSRDLVARSGGDEFVLLIHADRDEADALLARIREAASHSWSWGLARATEFETLDELMARADAELYEMKRHRS
jgi:diguanylate cyclase (GGDEF)-like protein